jgi:glycosyltransferase involved in cell wall biosynthesis
MKGPINVLYVMDHGEMGGVQRFLDSLLKAHNRDFFNIVILTFKEGSWIQDLRDYGLKVYSLDGMGVRKLFAIIPKVMKILNDENIQIVHSTYSWAHFLTWVPSFLLGLKKVWFHHGPIEHKKWQGYYQLFRSDFVLTNSEYMKGVIENTILNSGGIKVLPYGIESGPFEYDEAKRTTKRQELGLRENEIAVGIIGFIDDWKGQDVFLKAAKEFKENPQVKFYIIGDIRPGKAQERCQNFKNSLQKLQNEEEINNVTFTGALNIKEGILDALDIFVHASLWPSLQC